MKRKKVLFTRLPAYTLLEMLIVLTIIGILLTVGLATYSKVQTTAMIKSAQIELRQYHIAIQSFKADLNAMPVNAGELLEKGYITKQLLNDPWGTEFRLEVDNSANTVKIISAGPGKQFGTKDNIIEEVSVL